MKHLAVVLCTLILSACRSPTEPRAVPCEPLPPIATYSVAGDSVANAEWCVTYYTNKLP